MNHISELKFHEGSKEEQLPGYAMDFPYIASRAELDRYAGRFVPWHWHKAVELFYMESGTLEYSTPKGKMVFSAGMGGFVNSNVLHMTRPLSANDKNVQLLHIFDPCFVAGNQGSRIERKYILPIAASQLEIMAFCPDIPAHARILESVKEAFGFSEDGMGYEMKVRESMSRIWMMVYESFHSCINTDIKQDKNDERLKTMMIYVHEHYADKITVSELAAAGYISERECFRIFRDFLHLSPLEYINSYRLQAACHMLANGQESVTEIGRACGLGSGSYFGKLFREYAKCTPTDYRRKWQDNTKKCQE